MNAGRRSRGTTTRDVVVADLRRRILDLTLPPGGALAENELAKELAVSRTPVREALILLVNEGLVEIYPQMGTFVSRIDPAAVADSQFVREALELASLHELVPVIEPTQITTLRGILAQQRLAVDSADVDQFFDLDERFHRTMMELAGHGSAWSVVGSAKAHLDRARRACLPVADTLERMVQQHTDIVDQLAAGDLDDTDRSLRSHLREVFRDIDAVKSLAPHYFTNGDQRLPRRTERPEASR
ncbi:DNA-binding GntR family transcriptional regulator [Saccharopolyspora lacisalsi]|uniref:DNA-binding GntR family transcriptional regulator n=1 Tax=Halosaccharopolyspora lacisalsi TaxID=1000566 RepID=A0A839DY98_9PSEU|nr:GntR family transcriptional regulator [Halosaccharopolyspora lacisalsi]MBA8824325.1 DNA-binding GntR family transcriptional regulator [Halosaccharopolyspora lacisalsi]